MLVSLLVRALRNWFCSSGHKRPAAVRADPYVKIIVMDAGGHKKFQSKTSVRAGEINPIFQETYLYDLPQSQLKEVTVIVSVYNNKARTAHTHTHTHTRPPNLCPPAYLPSMPLMLALPLTLATPSHSKFELTPHARLRVRQHAFGLLLRHGSGAFPLTALQCALDEHENASAPISVVRTTHTHTHTHTHNTQIQDIRIF